MRWSISAQRFQDGLDEKKIEGEEMLSEQTMEKLNAMKLFGMANAFRHWLDSAKGQDIGPADLIGILADAEWLYRENRKLITRLRNARLKQPACVEDIDYAHPRGLNKTMMHDLATSRWAQSKQNIIITGKTGVGKSYLACALAHKACRDGLSSVYRRASRLLDELTLARADGSFAHLLRRLAKAQVLVIDDFGLETLGTAQRRDLLEVIEDRYAVSSTIVTSQLDPNEWHAVIGDPTIADALCDRLVHNAHRIKLAGESIRKTGSTLTKGDKGSK